MKNIIQYKQYNNFNSAEKKTQNTSLMLISSTSSECVFYDGFLHYSFPVSFNFSLIIS